jgi:hypothetical protein
VENYRDTTPYSLVSRISRNPKLMVNMTYKYLASQVLQHFHATLCCSHTHSAALSSSHKHPDVPQHSTDPFIEKLCGSEAARVHAHLQFLSRKTLPQNKQLTARRIAEGWFCYRLPELGDELGLTPTQVRRLIKVLEKAGFIETTRAGQRGMNFLMVEVL